MTIHHNLAFRTAQNRQVICGMCGLSASVHDGATLHAHLANGARKTIETTTMVKENRGLRMLKIHFPAPLQDPGRTTFPWVFLAPDRKNTWKLEHTWQPAQRPLPPQVSHTPHEKLLNRRETGGMCGLSASVHDGATLHAHLANGARKTIETTTMVKENRGMLKIHFPAPLQDPGRTTFPWVFLAPDKKNTWKLEHTWQPAQRPLPPQVSHTPHEKLLNRSETGTRQGLPRA